MTNPLSRFRSEFADYPAADMPDVPASWSDESWHNEPCPSFAHVSGAATLWVDYLRPDLREWPDTPRFSLELAAIGPWSKEIMDKRDTVTCEVWRDALHLMAIAEYHTALQFLAMESTVDTFVDVATPDQSANSDSGYAPFINDEGESYGSCEVLWVDHEGAEDESDPDAYAYESGWYWIAGFPGCMSDGDELTGPFLTSTLARADANGGNVALQTGHGVGARHGRP